MADEFVHRGHHFARTKVDDPQGRLEKAAAEYWEKGYSNSLRTLPYAEVLRTVLVDHDPFRPFSGHAIKPPPLTQDMATAMATVFQWVFTPIGRSALYEVCRKAGWELKMSPLPKDPPK